MVVAQEEEWRHIERGGDAEKVIEAERSRAARERPVISNLADIAERLDLIAERGGAIDRPAQSQVPLADAVGEVAVLSEHRGDGHPAGFDQGRGVPAQDSPLKSRSPCVAACEDSISRGRTDRRPGVGVGETNALRGQMIDIRGRDLALRVEASHVAITQIIGQDIDDIRPRRPGKAAQEWHGLESDKSGPQTPARHPRTQQVNMEATFAELQDRRSIPQTDEIRDSSRHQGNEYGENGRLRRLSPGLSGPLQKRHREQWATVLGLHEHVSLGELDSAFGSSASVHPIMSLPDFLRILALVPVERSFLDIPNRRDVQIEFRPKGDGLLVGHHLEEVKIPSSFPLVGLPDQGTDGVMVRVRIQWPVRHDDVGLDLVEPV